MLTRQRSASLKPERQLILPNDRLAIVMVGLPARGKSFMAKKVYRYLRHLQIITKVFNFGSYRRIATKNVTVGKPSASFFDPDNKQGAKIRQQCCIDALHDLISWYNTGGQIGILDATNTTLQRRQLIRDFFSSKKSELEYNISILHIESICNDDSIIHNNIITVKLKNPDYCTVDAQKAIKDFKQRIKMYKKAYCEVSKDEGSYIKIIDVGTEVTGHEINDYISCRIFYFLMHLRLHRLTKTPNKPLLMQLKNRNDTKKENDLVDKLKKICGSVGSKFTRPAYDRPVHALAPYMRRPSYLMWTESEDTYKSANNVLHANARSPKVNMINTKPQLPKAKTIPIDKIESKNNNSENNTNMINKSFGQFSPIKMDPPIKNINLSNLASPPIQNESSNTSSHSVSFDNKSTRTPIQIGASITATTPTPYPYIRNKPRVRKSTLIVQMVSKRDLMIQESPKLESKSTSELNNIAMVEDNKDNNSDHELESEDLTRTNSNSIRKRNKYSPILEYKEYVTSDVESVDLDTDGETDNDNEQDCFACELCGRTVLKKETSLVESRDINQKKVRICEVCLYESESEDETNDEQYNSAEMIDMMHSAPVSVLPSQTGSPRNYNLPENNTNNNQLENVQMHVQEMENTVNALLNQLEHSNNHMKKNKNFKHELLRLQQKMQDLFQ